MENARLYIFFALSLLIIVGFYLIVPTPRPVPPPAAPGKAAPSSAAQESGAPLPGAPAAPLATPAPAVPAPAIPRAASKIVTVETPLYVAQVDTRGGRITHFTLKHYRQSKRSLDWGDLIPPLRVWIPAGKADNRAEVEMIKREVPGQDLLGLRFLGDDALTRTFDDTAYTVSTDSLAVADSDREGKTLTLRASGPGGLTVEKRIVFRPDTYVLGYTVNLINYGPAARPLRVLNEFGEGPATNDTSTQRGAQVGPIERDGGKTRKPDVGDIEGQMTIKEPQWLGIADAYFISAARPLTPVAAGVYVALNPPGATVEKKHRIPAYGIELPQTDLGPQKMVSSAFALYLGPKATDDMLKFGQRLEDSLDLTLDFLAAPMLAMLRWFESFTGNFGIAIMMLTILVRVVLFPLTYRGMVSMKRMQKLQPRMATIREKFKGDRERMNKEMMELYRKHKINPLGGCLPIVVQIPIFFALYSALISAIELRHAPFMLWITDLSAHDGLYILPVIMGGTMFMQQRFTPTSLDPMQAKIMMWMPVVFSVFMLTFPSGLMVYWSTSNVLSITQQVIINRVKVPEPAEG